MQLAERLPRHRWAGDVQEGMPDEVSVGACLAQRGFRPWERGRDPVGHRRQTARPGPKGTAAPRTRREVVKHAQPLPLRPGRRARIEGAEVNQHQDVGTRRQQVPLHPGEHPEQPRRQLQRLVGSHRPPVRGVEPQLHARFAHPGAADAPQGQG